jgi:hypothetical protein
MATPDELMIRAAQLKHDRLEKSKKFILDYMVEKMLEHEILTAMSYGKARLLLLHQIQGKVVLY